MHIRLNRSYTGPSLLAVALAAGCGSSGGNNPSSDSGAASDAAGHTDARLSGDAQKRGDAEVRRDSAAKDTGMPPSQDSGGHDAGAPIDASTPVDATTPIDTGAPVDGSADSFVAADGGFDAPVAVAPTVLSTSPIQAAASVPVNSHVSALFSEAMDPTTLTAAVFTVASGTPLVPVAGSIVYASSQAVFWPAAALAPSTSFTATITTGARSASGIALGATYVWSFTTGASAVAGVPVDLATAGNYVALAKTGISTVSPAVVTGNMGVSPAAATYITGFSLILDGSGTYSTSSQVTGKVYAADYKSPTPTNLTTAIGDMGTAFTAAAARAPDVTGLGAGSIGGMTLPAGVYRWGTGLLMATNVTLTGNANDVWIFQVAKDLTVSNGVDLVLSGGALPRNVFWQVSGAVTLGTTVKFDGTILSQTAISLKTGASITGRLLAQSAITLDASTVVAPL